MRVRLLQIIDFWVGVPLCFLVSVWHSIFSLIAPRQTEDAIRHILFIELSEMGSAILAYSSLVQAQRKFPQAKLYFLIFRKNSESCAILNLIPAENILVIDDSNLLAFSLSTLRALQQLHRIGIDTVIDLELFSRCTALLTYLSGACRRVGFHRATNEGLYRGNLLTHDVPYNPHLHIALNFLALVEALQAPATQIPLVKNDLRSELLDLPQLHANTTEKAQVWELLKRESPELTENNWLLVFNPDPGEALPIRGWPVSNFIAVAEQLLSDLPQAIVVVIGLKGSKPYAEKLQHSLGTTRCLDLTGKTPTLRSVVTLLEFSKVLVTNDSGPAHLAALTALPSVVLYGPETPALYGPLSRKATTLFAHYSCSPCLSALNHRHTRCTENLCLKAISVAEVYQATRKALGLPEEQRKA